MSWKSAYTKSLESRIIALENLLKSAEQRIEKLVDRLLAKNNVPDVGGTDTINSVDDLGEMGLFEDTEVDKDTEIVDTRKETQLDAFAR